MPPLLRVVLAAVLWLLGGPLHAQRFPPDTAVDRLFAPWDRPESPGCALGIVKDGHFIYERGYGMANLDYDIPNSPRMVYYVGSVSKQFTAAAVAMLALDGKLSLSDDIRKHIPEMPDYRARYGVPVTIEQLIHHTSGMRDIYTLMSLAGLRMEDVMTDDAMLALIARQRELSFTPGSEYLYSNSPYWLLGQIVKRVSGQSLRVFAEERIFRPLGMTHTHFHDDPGHVLKGRAMSYEPDSGGGFRISYLQNFDKTGAGGLYTTVEDLQKWDENFHSHQVGGEALQALVHRRGVLTGGDTLRYAFGNEVGTYRGLRTEEHGGSLMGFQAYVLRFPDQHFSVLETCNLGSIEPGPIARQIADLRLGDLMTKAGPVVAPAPVPRRSPRSAPSPAPPAPPTPAELRRFVGEYYSEELDVTYRIVAAGDSLLLRRRSVADARLRPVDRDTFSAAGDAMARQLTLRFEPRGAARPASFLLEAERVTGIRFRRR